MSNLVPHEFHVHRFRDTWNTKRVAEDKLTIFDSQADQNANPESHEDLEAFVPLFVPGSTIYTAISQTCHATPKNPFLQPECPPKKELFPFPFHPNLHPYLTPCSSSPQSSYPKLHHLILTLISPTSPQSSHSTSRSHYYPSSGNRPDSPSRRGPHGTRARARPRGARARAPRRT